MAKKNDQASKKEEEKKDRGMYEQSPVKVNSSVDSGVQIKLLASKASNTDANEVDLLISISSNNVEERCPQDVVCVVDISGSMGTEATMTSTDGSKESDGLSLLSLVSHAVRTVGASLSDKDRLAVVAFDDVAESVLPLTHVSDLTKSELVTKVNELRPRNCTNIWAGLEAGLEILRNSSKSNDERRIESVILLTDGVPTTSPKGGEAQALREYINKHEQLPGTVMTFGFGYGINSDILTSIAEVGGGLYCFIPDASIVGTAFVNCVSNLQSTFAKNVVLSVEPLEGSSISDKQVGGHQVSKVSWGSQFHLSTLQSGQTKDVVVKMKNVDLSRPFVNVSVEFFNGLKTEKVEFKGTIELNSEEEVQVQKARLEAVDLIKSIKKGDKNSIQKYVNHIRPLEKDARVKTLIQDLEGQVVESVGDGYQKWGKHYLPSLARAHQFQQCNNFKDFGVQNYGGKVFNSVRDHLDNVFLKLAPPVPTVGANAGSNTPVQMGRYYNAYGGCFRGDCRAKMYDGSLKPVANLRKGDLVSSNGKSAQVVCVVKTVYASGRAKLVTLPSGLVLTAYHPVKESGKWVFPKDLAEEQEQDCDAVYSFLLTEGHVMNIEGVECVTLAHGIEENDVVKHAYFGTERVAEDVRRMEGFSEGLVVITPDSFVRDPKTNQVVGLTNSPQVSTAVAEILAC